jgi:hypothetical protein
MECSKAMERSKLVHGARERDWVPARPGRVPHVSRRLIRLTRIRPYYCSTVVTVTLVVTVLLQY